MNLALSLLAATERAPLAEAAVDGDRRLTYEALLERSARVQAGSPPRESARGDRVAAIARNRLETVELFWACQWLGAVFVPLSHRSTRDEVEYCVADWGAALFLDGDADLEVGGGDPIPGLSTYGTTSRRSCSTRPGRQGGRRGCPAPIERSAQAPWRRSSSTDTDRATARSASCLCTTRWATTRCSRCR